MIVKITKEELRNLIKEEILKENVNDSAGMSKTTWKKINTVGDLIKYLQLIPDSIKIAIASDEEENEVHKILCFKLYKEGAVLIPWEA